MAQRTHRSRAWVGTAPSRQHAALGTNMQALHWSSTPPGQCCSAPTPQTHPPGSAARRKPSTPPRSVLTSAGEAPSGKMTGTPAGSASGGRSQPCASASSCRCGSCRRGTEMSTQPWLSAMPLTAANTWPRKEAPPLSLLPEGAPQQWGDLQSRLQLPLRLACKPRALHVPAKTAKNNKAACAPPLTLPPGRDCRRLWGLPPRRGVARAGWPAAASPCTPLLPPAGLLPHLAQTLPALALPRAVP